MSDKKLIIQIALTYLFFIIVGAIYLGIELGWENIFPIKACIQLQ